VIPKCKETQERRELKRKFLNNKRRNSQNNRTEIGKVIDCVKVLKEN